MARIGIFGGSFNPPHLGHVRAAEVFCRAMKLDKLILIPTAVPPHKRLASGSPDAKTRLELTKLAFSDLQLAEVSDVEILREGPSYTLDTLWEIHKQYPADELFLLMGTDMFLSFHTWHKPEEIAKLATLVCVMRVDCDEAIKKQLQEQETHLRERYLCHVEFLQNPVLEISSTQVRRLLFFGCAEQFLPPKVLEKILADGLYGTADDKRGLSLEELTKWSLAQHKAKRLPHAEGCSELAASLARRYGANELDAARAGILHDITKALSPEEQFLLCVRFRVALTPDEKLSAKLLHAATAAAVAEHIFGENEAVCTAIRWHTTGRENMSLLEKIIYIADYAEPNRDFPGVDELRSTLEKDLDAAVVMGLEMTIAMLQERGQQVCAQSLQARDFLQKERKLTQSP